MMKYVVNYCLLFYLLYQRFSIFLSFQIDKIKRKSGEPSKGSSFSINNKILQPIKIGKYFMIFFFKNSKKLLFFNLKAVKVNLMVFNSKKI